MLIKCWLKQLWNEKQKAKGVCEVNTKNLVIKRKIEDSFASRSLRLRETQIPEGFYAEDRLWT